MADSDDRSALMWRPTEGRARWPWMVAAGVAVAALLGVVALFVGDGAPAGDRPEDIAAEPKAAVLSAAVPSSASRSAGEAAKASATAVVAKAASAKPSSTGKVVAPADVSACVASLFAEDAFGGETPDLGFVCETTVASQGAIELETRLVKGQRGRGVTTAMKQWSVLGWYEMAAFAIIRSICCPRAAKLKSKRGHSCDFDVAINELARVGAGGDDAARSAALDGYNKSIRCLVNLKLQGLYGYGDAPYGPEQAVLLEMVQRASGH